MQNGQTQSAEITVQKLYINDKGPCKIIDETGKEWKFWKPGKFGGIDPDRFEEGAAYKIGYEIKPYNGKDEFYIKHLVDGQSRPAVPKVLHKPHKPEPRPPTNPIDGERMGTMGMVNAFIQGGGVDLQRDAIKAAISTCRAAYNDIWGSPKKQEVDAEFNDEIPY